MDYYFCLFAQVFSRFLLQYPYKQEDSGYALAYGWVDYALTCRQGICTASWHSIRNSKARLWKVTELLLLDAECKQSIIHWWHIRGNARKRAATIYLACRCELIFHFLPIQLLSDLGGSPELSYPYCLVDGYVNCLGCYCYYLLICLNIINYGCSVMRHFHFSFLDSVVLLFHTSY